MSNTTTYPVAEAFSDGPLEAFGRDLQRFLAGEERGNEFTLFIERPLKGETIRHHTTKENTNDMRRTIAAELSGLLADSYVLMNRTQLYHWNIEGAQFKGLHDLFEKQYRELVEAVDEIAERIRTIGYYTPGSLDDIIKASEMPRDRLARDSREILLHLIEGHQQVIRRAKLGMRQADEAHDHATLDLLSERLRTHEKTTWMLRSQAAPTSEELAAERLEGVEALAR